MGPFVRRWWSALLVMAFGVIFAVLNVVVGNVVAGVLIGLLLIAFGLAISPAIFPRSRGWAESLRLARSRQAPLILWKPGCSWCIRMRFALGTAGNRAVWVDIWDDPEAAAAARQRNDGNETTPTVVIGDESWTNPEPAQVRGRLPAHS